MSAADKLKLWFFRDISRGHRQSLYSIFGMPVAEIRTHGDESHVFKRILSNLKSEGEPALSLPVSNTGENAYVALLRHHDNPDNLKAVLVPTGQTLDFDEDAATRRWLWPHLGYEFHLVAFVPLGVSK